MVEIHAVKLGACLLLLCLTAAAGAQTVTPLSWPTIERGVSFRAAMEKENYTTLDPQARMVFAVQGGGEDMRATWSIVRDDDVLLEGEAPLGSGMACVDFSLADFAPGRYELKASSPIGEPVRDVFYVVKVDEPTRAGRVAIVVPKGVANVPEAMPLSAGVPFPKGALRDKDHVRLVTADGQPVPCETQVRSRWGASDDASVRWLGVDFQSADAPAWWPRRDGAAYYLEYGEEHRPVAAKHAIDMTQTPEGLQVSNGVLSFTINTRGFNLIDDVHLRGRRIADALPTQGAYLVDHEGNIYRAANDRDVSVTIEKRGALRSVIRAEGWYVRDGSSGDVQHYTLPTDKLCKFITRIEVYAGKPFVRVLHTNVITYDTFTVRLRDMGVSLPAAGAKRAWFGVEGDDAIEVAARDEGVYLLQHLPHTFDVMTESGERLGGGRHTAGWMAAETADGIVTVSHRETWERFPKEFELLPGEMRLHIWPAHGIDHPEINVLEHAQLNHLWFAHQGREMDLTFPWEYVLAIAKLVDIRPSGGGINPSQMAYRSVQYGGMGVGMTSDFLLSFDDNLDDAQRTAAHFERNVQAAADPAWTCASGALGMVHPYDPQQFPVLEEIIEKANKARWQTMDESDDYGMWTYRCWHDRAYYGEGRWDLHRAKCASHHHDAYMPWLLYARSADPDYYDQGVANTRFLSDVQVLHYNDPNYPQHQRMVGTMTHATAITPWSHDEHLVGHQICYVSLITGYYLTGNLRLREVVVDEWQKSLLERRDDPNFANAYFTTRTLGRDSNCTLGELIDLYQLTYHPALVALIDEFMGYAKDTPTNWGIWKENVFAFDGSRQLRDYVLKLAQHYRDPQGQPIEKVFGDAPPSHWNDNHATRGDELAWASIFDADEDDDLRAFFAMNPVNWLKTANDMAQIVPGYVWVPVPDQMKIMPRVMHALARHDRAATSPWMKAVAQFPTSTRDKATRVIVREDVDRDFTLHIAGHIAAAGVRVQVVNPLGEVVMDQALPGEPRLAIHRLRVAADGCTGDYNVFVHAHLGGPDARDDLYAPLTVDMPEVYVAPTFAQNGRGNSFFYTRAAGDQPVRFKVAIRENRAIVYDAKRETILADWPREMLIHPPQGKRPTIPSEVEVGGDGVFFTTYAGYTQLESPDQPMVYSVSADRWFMPDAEVLQRPAP